jgi:peptidyl-prolyl cis-trans isomerase C
MIRRFPERVKKMMGQWKLAVGILVFIVCVNACSNPDNTIILEDNSRIAVKVNGKSLTRGQMHHELVNLLLAVGSNFPQEVIEQKRAEFRAQAIQNLINTELLVEEAVRRGYTVSPQDVEERLNQLREAYSSQEQFREELNIRDLTDRELAEEARRGLYVEMVIDQEIETVARPDEEEISLFYDQNKTLFAVPEQIHAAHIIIQVHADDSRKVRDAKRAELERLRQLIIDGADFGDTAFAHSDCPSRFRNGDLGWITRDRMTPEFTQVAFALDPGTISGIVETPVGFHLIKVFDRHPERIPELHEVREHILHYLVEERKKERIQSLIESLREQATIDIVSDQR